MVAKTTTIRQNLKSIIEAVPSLGATVFDTNTLPFDSAELPIVNIFTLSESRDTQNRAYHPLNFKLTEGEVEIQLVLSADSDLLGQTIDDLKNKIINVIDSNRTVNDAINAIEFVRVDYDYAGIKTEMPHVIAVMLFNVEYIEE